jgi:hypothetical protein
MATKNAKKNVETSSKGRGLWDPARRTFTPFPLDICFPNPEIMDDDDVQLTLEADPEVEGRDFGKPDTYEEEEYCSNPLLIKYSLVVPVERQLGVLLYRRAKDLGIPVEKLPFDTNTPPETEEEAEHGNLAFHALADLFLAAIIRWSNLQEVDSPATPTR